MSKLERLLNLTAVLLDTERPLTAEDLRQMVEGYPPPGPSFRRAFERDKDDLRELGIPLRVERVPATDPPLDGYRIPPEEYYLPDPGLEGDELAAVHLASMAVRLDGFGEQEALWKLGGADVPAPGPVAQSIASIPADPNLVPVFSGITGNRTVLFRYREVERIVEPWRLDFLRGRWYLTGWDRGKNATRQYRLDRIEGEVTLAEDQVPQHARPTGSLQGRRRAAWEMGDDSPVMVRLLVDTRLAASAAHQFDSEIKSEHTEHGVIFNVPVINEEAFRSFVLGFLEHAEVLSPPEVRARTIAWLQQQAGDVRLPGANASLHEPSTGGVTVADEHEEHAGD